MKNDNISAFAYNTGKLIEELIDTETNNLREENNKLTALILTFRQSFTDTYPELEDYDEHFGIINIREGL